MDAALLISGLAAFGALSSAACAFFMIQNTKKQALFSLWQHISLLSHVDPNAPIWPDVYKNLSALELTGACFESQVVSRKLITRTFRDTFMQLYEEIMKIQVKDNMHRDGNDLLNRNNAARKLYSHFDALRIKGTG